ncbi:multiple sugar transport system substrate-binding protein [Paenibacillus endophyticus]|uniref:Multiple sugar transport system substrate-binding protein n=1 Tax=Paenibacillus endophyticus TaxID=1294268 RepID=A0A7W5CBT4_9BACL|nr:ABC transporter substrate-binding protein [Paenibacillus endophyticus]MBB3154775.1 multiple sugar transport system substrate-binding protein [Paenibacillus endophyticus]
MKKYYLLLIFVFIMAGCQSRQPEEPESKTLKVLAFNAQQFNQLYGNFFLATHPNYTLNVVSIMDSLEAGTNITTTIEELIDKENPDIVVNMMDSFSVLVEKGKLVSLEDFIKKDKFDIEAYSPAVIDYLRNEQGALHGLAPTFNSNALFYNKKLFDQYGLAYPAGLITWDEMFEIAQQFPSLKDKENRQFGLYYKNLYSPFMMGLTIGEGSGLSMINDGKFTLDTPSWHNVFQHVALCFKNSVCYDPNESIKKETRDIKTMEQESYPFLNGNIALAIDGFNLYKILEKNKDADETFEWGVVSFPTSAENPDMGNGIEMNDIISISANAPDANNAWEFVSYVAGKNYAKLLPQINLTELPSRSNSDMEDQKIAAFYQLQRINNKLINQLRDLPAPLITMMDEITPAYMSDISSGKISVPEALATIEKQLNIALSHAGK